MEKKKQKKKTPASALSSANISVKNWKMTK